MSSTHLKDDSLPISQRLRDPPSLLLSKHNPIELPIHRMVPIECTCILRDHIELPTQRRKRPAVDRVAMRGAEDVRPRTVDRAVNREGGSVEKAHGPRFGEDAAVMIDEE